MPASPAPAPTPASHRRPGTQPVPSPRPIFRFSIDEPVPEGPQPLDVQVQEPRATAPPQSQSAAAATAALRAVWPAFPPPPATALLRSPGRPMPPPPYQPPIPESATKTRQLATKPRQSANHPRRMPATSRQTTLPAQPRRKAPQHRPHRQRRPQFPARVKPLPSRTAPPPPAVDLSTSKPFWHSCACLLALVPPPPPMDDGGSAPARDPADVGGGGDGSSAGAGGDRGPVDYRADYNSFPPSAHSVFDPPHDAYVSDEEFQRRRAELIDDICAANGFPAHPLPPLGAAGAASVGEPGVDRAAHARRVAVDYFLLGRPGQFPVATPADWACDGRLRPFDDPVVAQRLNHQVDYGYQGGKSEVFLNVREKYLAATSAMVVIQLTVQHLQQCLADLAYSPHILTEAGQRLCVSLLRALHVQKQLYDGFLKRVSRVRILVTHGKQAAAAIDAHDPFDSHIRAGGLDADSQRLLAQYTVEEELRKRKAATRRTTGRSNDSSRSKPSASAGSSNRGGGKGATRAAAPGAAAAGKG